MGGLVASIPVHETFGYIPRLELISCNMSFIFTFRVAESEGRAPPRIRARGRGSWKKGRLVAPMQKLLLAYIYVRESKHSHASMQGNGTKHCPSLPKGGPPPEK